MRQCPSGCGYKRSGHEIDRAALDIRCPRCLKFNLSEFKDPPPPIIYEPTQDYGDWLPCYGGTE